MKQFRILFIITVIVCLGRFYSMSQSKSLEVDISAFQKTNGLKVGDPVPDIKFKMINFQKPAVRLSDFKGKLVILDFWATWCSSCIAAFPKLASLQNVFKDKLQVLLVNSLSATWDKAAKINQFYKARKESGQAIRLGTAVEDSLAISLFPHESVPHYVWISPEGRVEAVTGSDDITTENIHKILAGQPASFSTKRDFYADRIFSFGEIPIDQTTRYSFFKRGRLKGVGVYPARTRYILGANKKHVEVGIAIYNEPLLNIYRSALMYNQDFRKSASNKKRWIIKVMDSADLFFDRARMARETWEREHLYSCDIVVQSSEFNELGNIMLDHLNKATNYWARIEKKKIKCLVIVKARDFVEGVNKIDLAQALQAKHYTFSNTYLSVVVDMLNKRDNTLPLIIDETNSTELVNIMVDKGKPDLLDFKKQLNDQGFDIIEEEREMEMFLITDKIPL